MTTVTNKYTLLTDSLLELGYTLYKGYPTFGKPQFNPPYLAAVYASSGRPVNQRVGGENNLADAFRLFIVATNEVELLKMVDDMTKWFNDNRRIVSEDGSIKCQMVLSQLSRDFDFAEMEIENYVVSMIVTLQ